MNKKLILILILLIASFLRLWKLSDYPAGFNADEAALGYNSYSLLLTGRDEHGHPWPVNLESFGDFKPAGYSYLLMPFIKVLGLTEFAVRLPSAVFGVVAVAFIYFLTREIISEHAGLVSAFLLAVSPWHLHFSRGAWEVNVSTTLILIGVWSFIKWTKSSRSAFLSFSVLFLVLSMYFYQSARIIAPAIGIGLALLYFKQIVSRSKQAVLNFLLLLALLLPLGISVFSTDAASRLSGVGLLADEGPLRRVEQLRGQHVNWGSFISRLFHNRPVIYFIQFAKNYSDHFDGDFLFVNGDEIQRNRVPETGLLYLSDFIILLIGAVYLLRNSRPDTKVIWLWLLLAPLASSLTFQTPHALRAHSLAIPLTILVSAGVVTLISRSRLLLLLIVPLYVFQISRYLHQYYIHYPQTYPAAWEYGFKQLVPYLESQKANYEKVWVTDKYDQPYILFLFYSRFPPEKFQNNHTLTFRDKFNFSTVRDFDKYHFESTPWDKVRDIHSTLIVAVPEDLPDVGVNIVKTFTAPGGQAVFEVVSN